MMTLRRTLLAFALSLAPMLSVSAAMADNWTVKDSTGATVTLGSKAVSGVQYQQHQMVDSTGAALGVAGNPVAIDSIVRSTASDRGGTIAAGGTAQQFMAANTSRRGYSIQNQSAGDEYINCIATATVDYHSLKIPSGALYETSSQYVGTGACSIIGATTGQAFYVREF